MSPPAPCLSVKALPAPPPPPPSRTDSAKGCRAFVKEVGPVVAFGTLAAEDLAKCGVTAS
jgi:hypothetical protein